MSSSSSFNLNHCITQSLSANSYCDTVSTVTDRTLTLPVAYCFVSNGTFSCTAQVAEVLLRKKPSLNYKIKESDVEFDVI